VREKIYDPSLKAPDASYHRYHAELFAGEKGVAGKNIKWNRKLRGSLRTPLRGDAKQVMDRCSCLIREPVFLKPL
jgi:hypothetical protein